MIETKRVTCIQNDVFSLAKKIKPDQKFDCKSDDTRKVNSKEGLVKTNMDGAAIQIES